MAVCLRICLLTAAVFSFVTISTPFGETDSRKARLLRWRKGPIKIALSTSLTGPNSSIKPESDVRGALVRSLNRWEEAADVEFDLLFSDLLAISPGGKAGDGVSLITIAPATENLLAFSKKHQNASALTRVFFDERDRITEADIALNPNQQFSSDLTFDTYDLESVFTHEIGHLLGLEHTYMGSSVMFDGVPKNGFLEAAGLSRELSSEDVTNLRSLYGGKNDADCCGTIRIRASAADRKNSVEIFWVQDAATGALIQSRLAAAGNAVNFSGLSSGRYEIYSQPKGSFSSVPHGSVSLNGTDVEIPTKSPMRKPAQFDIQFLGTGGQVSKRGVRLAGGQTYRVLVAGRNLDRQPLQFATTSSLIQITRSISETQQFESDLTAVVLNLEVDRAIKPGQYSLYAESPSGQRIYIVGAITID